MDEPALGWLPDNEPQHDEALAPFSVSRFLCSAPGDIPDTLDPEWFLQKQQGYTPFCHAFMRAGIEEILSWLATQGQQVYNFSRYHAAIGDMLMDGNANYPNGASIGGSLRASLKLGTALDELMPWLDIFNTQQFARGYSSKIPSAVQANAKLHSMQSIVPGIRSYADLDAALSSGVCAVGYGLTWTTGFDALRGVEFCDKVPGGTVRGGHAQLAFGWVTRAGERWYYNHNSHQGWGKRMRIAYSPRMWDQILSRSQYGAFACSIMKLDDAKPITPPGWGWLAKANFGGSTKLTLHS